MMGIVSPARSAAATKAGLGRGGEGRAGAHFQPDSPRHLAQPLLLLTALWAAPILQPAPPEEVRSRCLFRNQLPRPFGFALMDEELIRQLEGYWRA